jgi:NADPH-dependent 2,4-dienoyl-CoA reductase/sulfur reductase-like enzyme
VRALEDAVSLRGLLDAGLIGRALAVGTDYLGLEMAAALVHQCIHVVLVELTDRVLGTVDPPLVDPVSDEVRRHGVDLRLRTALTEVHSTTFGLSATIGGRSTTVDAVIVAVGAQPAARLAAVAGAATGPAGAMLVDAIRTGPFARVVGTALVKVLHQAMARTGLTLSKRRRPTCRRSPPLRSASLGPRTTQGPTRCTSGWCRDRGRLPGAQLVGGGGVAKRIDAAAAAPHADLDVDDLTGLNLSYAPQASVYEPVLLAAQAAAAHEPIPA